MSEVQLRANETILFLHVPKAAGSTLNRIIRRQYPRRSVYEIGTDEAGHTVEDFKALTDSEKSRLKVLQGHMPFGLHEEFSNPTTYITILRDPADRVVSMYYYILRYKKHYLHEELTTRKITLEQFVSEPYSPETENGMVKAISAQFTPFGGATRDHLQMAISNLECQFSVVGTADRFDDTLWLIKKRFGWFFPYYLSENVTPQRPTKDRISAEALSTIQSNNQLDQELYDYAQNRLDREISKYGPSFTDELKRFRRLSHPVATMHQAARTIRYALCPWRKQR